MNYPKIDLKSVDEKEVNALITRLFSLIEREEPTDSSLSWGRSSLILLYMYYGHFQGNEEFTNRGIEEINKVFADIGSEETTINSCNLYAGLIGILCVLVNLRNSEILDIDFDTLADLENLCFDWAYNEMEAGNLDFLNGGVGIFSYLLQKAQVLLMTGQKSASFEAYCEKVCTLFERLISEDPLVINKFYNEHDDQSDSHVNFGLAHGLSGMLIPLMQLKSMGYGQSISEPTLKGAIDKIVNLRDSINVPDPYYFVSDIDINTKKMRFQRRLGWCHSDLNLIHLLLQYRSTFDSNDNYELKIKEGIESIVQRNSFETNRLQDPFLCHGYAGLSQYYRLINSYGENDLCLTALEDYISQTLQYFESHNDAYFFSEKFNETSDNISFLYGNVGVALVLLTYLEPASSKWSQILLI
ncbi:MAG: hypothetical protein P1U56_23065 [Saprospiraceae bacterium]|nr:hypothetical protein [Saprospiraceae bacterium]